jgi:prophage regulatory protein
MNTNTPARILRMPEVQNRTGLSRTTLYLLTQKNQFPKNCQLGSRAVGWLEADITKWINDRAAASKGGAK